MGAGANITSVHDTAEPMQISIAIDQGIAVLLSCVIVTSLLYDAIVLLYDVATLWRHYSTTPSYYYMTSLPCDVTILRRHRITIWRDVTTLRRHRITIWRSYPVTSLLYDAIVLLYDVATLWRHYPTTPSYYYMTSLPYEVITLWRHNIVNLRLKTIRLFV